MCSSECNCAVCLHKFNGKDENLYCNHIEISSMRCYWKRDTRVLVGYVMNFSKMSSLSLKLNWKIELNAQIELVLYNAIEERDLYILCCYT